ncbi:hypothetical protein [Paenibacillus elgii]|uniref:hypothetical protein n=1 Tax=Paenibacillus elgii TaxID=189691 RepID=UPI00203BCA40|nr:hypothetical protein [Paenibacillus elgii]MCM3271804.1 hypothetical protein [Paenibacillus elgii]
MKDYLISSCFSSHRLLLSKPPFSTAQDQVIYAASSLASLHFSFDGNSSESYEMSDNSSVATSVLILARKSPGSHAISALIHWNQVPFTLLKVDDSFWLP